MSVIIKILKRSFIKVIIMLYDPLLSLTIGSKTIKVPLSHKLREYTVLFPHLNRNLPRIIKYLSKTNVNISLIDIGANIGDTAAFVKDQADIPILCIDGDENYIKLLRENTSQFNNVYICHTLVGSENKLDYVELKKDGGTAHLVEGKSLKKIRTLDNILEEFPDFQNASVIKTDTDGYDTHILRACSAYLDKIKPVLFFEFDPYLISLNNDDAFSFITFLIEHDYKYFMFYTNTGEYILSCTFEERSTIDQLIHFYSGRKMESFMDVCAFTSKDKIGFEMCRENEIVYFKKERGF